MWEKTKKILGIAGLIIVGLIVFYILYNYFQAFTSFAAAIMLVGISLGLWWFIDEFLLKSIDTIEELKKGNLAVALTFVGYSIIIAGAMISAFIVMKGGADDIIKVVQ